MANESKPTKLAGSERKPVPHSRATKPVQPDQQIDVTIRLRPSQDATALDAGGFSADSHPASRKYLTREEFASAHGASAEDIAKVKAFATQHHLVVVTTEPAQRRMVLSGSAAAFGKAFGVQLHEYEYPEGTYRGRKGHLTVPGELSDIIEGVFGLDDRLQAKPKFQIYTTSGFANAHVARSFTPPELAKIYKFPTGLDGTGQCIGIIELGGGVRPADINAYFAKLGLPSPELQIISVDHAKNRPSTPDSADGEVMLDIEVAAAVAPKAKIAVYFAPNTDRGFLDAVTMAVHDNVNKPSVISISWGAAEVNWTGQAMSAFEQIFTEAAAMGVTICCAAGDNGSTDGEKDGDQHVDFPASAPHSLACGGTNLKVAPDGSMIETVWNAGPDSATGGGYSKFFSSSPDYQKGHGNSKHGRGVPDVAGDADPATGYAVRVDGEDFVIGGTSAVAPLWAGLIALLNQALNQPIGFINPLLYGSLKKEGVTFDVTTGNNGAYKAKAGWDACTGWGSPNGQALLAALSA